MLHLPDDFRSHFVVAGHDPGTTFLGLGILHVDIQTLEIVASYAYTLEGAKMISERDNRVRMHGARHGRLMALNEELYRRYEYHRPDYIASEAAFYNPRTPGAFGPLTETIAHIRLAVERYNPLMPLSTFPPSVVKTAVGVGGGKKKEPMMDAVMKLPIHYQGLTPMADLSEHAIDSLAVAYALYLTLRKELS